MGLRDYTIYDFISRNATLNPKNDCIFFEDHRLTHLEFKSKCDHLAAGLLQQGVRPGDRLGVVSHNCDEFVFLYGAAAKIGAVLLPVNWRFQQDEVEYVLNDCTPKLLFAGPEFQKGAMEARDKVASVEQCFTIGGGAVPEGFNSFDSLYQAEGSGEEFDISADSGFVIIHTAATAGRPRGALLSQRNIITVNQEMMQNYQLGPNDCHLCILPLFHIAALSMAMSVMQAGGKNCILKTFDPELALKLIDREKATVFFHFAPVIKMLTDKYGELGTGLDLSSVRTVGGLDHPDNLKKFKEIAPNTRFLTGFGQTEAMGVAGGLIEERPGSAGRPSHIYRVALFDDYDRQVPVGSVGEICVRGPGVFLGYWGREEDNAYTFRNGWHHTGDMGRFDEDGYLWYVKRKAEKELIKPGGENVYPVEVEKAILSHGAVSEVCVIGVPDRQWGEAIKAVCVMEKGKSLDEEILTEFVASKIARYKKPKFVVFVESLPKTAEGEVDRDQVKKEHGGKY